MTPGKVRGLDALSHDGVFCVLAIDHRDSLKIVLGDGDVDAETITTLKLDLIGGIGARASGVMLEPEYSLPQALMTGALDGRSGFIAALESQGYTQDPWAGPTTMLDGWSAAQAKAMGASSAKLLLPYDPARAEHAAMQRDVVRTVAAECDALDLALLVEPVAFGMAGPDRAATVLQTVLELHTLGMDVLKLEFPGDPDQPDGWADACAAVTAASSLPWVLLSSGVTFAQYRDQLAVAFDNGCSGFTGGRAIWRPMTEVPVADRLAMIHSEVVPRFEALAALAHSTATPWSSHR